jgi:hypothetical protein
MTLTKVKQHFPRPKIPDDQIEAVVKQQFFDAGVMIAAGANIAIAVGSRGIANLPRSDGTLCLRSCLKSPSTGHPA